MSFPTARRQPASDTASIPSRSNSRRMASHFRTNSAGVLPKATYGSADGTRDAPAAILLQSFGSEAETVCHLSIGPLLEDKRMHRLIWDRFQIGIRHRFQIVRGLVKRGHASPPMVATSPITTPEAPRASSTKLIKRT